MKVVESFMIKNVKIRNKILEGKLQMITGIIFLSHSNQPLSETGESILLSLT